MNKESPAALMAKLRWKGFNKKERSEEMRKVANKGWIKRRAIRDNGAHLTKAQNSTQVCYPLYKRTHKI